MIARIQNRINFRLKEQMQNRNKTLRGVVPAPAMPHNTDVSDETFTIAPRSRGGFTLSGPNLPWPLWYATIESALEYAHIRGATRGGVVEVLDADGYPIRSEPIECEMAWLKT